jgi:hypothetical protein
MVRTEFTEEEAQIVKDVLESYISGLASEIYGMDTLTFAKTQDLVHKKNVVAEVIERMDKMVA